MKSFMAKNPESYVDTSAFIAFLDRRDLHHGRYFKLFETAPPLVTSSLVLAEGHGWFLRRYGPRRAIDFVRFIQTLPRLSIEQFGARDLGGVVALLGKFHDQDLTMADAHGLFVMRQRGISSCWSTDRHLALTGASLVM